MQKRKITLFAILIAVFIFSSFVIAAPALTTTTAQRNAIAYNWSYYTRGTYNTNCLAYALYFYQVDTWIWPWGGSNPTLSQVKTYMSNSWGYTGYDRNFIGPIQQCQIMAYGWSDYVTHFSRITYDGGGFSSGYCYAKWGRSETFRHTSLNPYTNAVYGPSICKFRK